MNIPKWCLITSMTFLLGCAPSYHDYPCGCVPYDYCVPAPLPFREFSDCDCPTPIASQYQASRKHPVTLPLPPEGP